MYLGLYLGATCLKDSKLKIVLTCNHKFEQEEHDTKSLSIILIKHLVHLGGMWHKYKVLCGINTKFNNHGMKHFQFTQTSSMKFWGGTQSYYLIYIQSQM